MAHALHVGIPPAHDGVRKSLRKQIAARDDSHHLVVVVDDAEEAEAEGAE